MFNRSLVTFLSVALFLYAGFCAWLYFFQRTMIYYPQPRRLEVTRMTLQRPDVRVLVTTEERNGQDALLYFGGNAEDVSVNLPDFARQFPDHALYLMHYRGYGESEGRPAETDLVADAFALFDEVAKKHRRVTVIGRSLGTGIAVRLAAARPVSRVVLVTPYDSIEYVARRAFPYVPVKWLLKDKYESWRYAPEISAPVLILMAEADEVIPKESTERLYRLFKKNVARLLVIPDARHNSISYSDVYQNAIGAFVNAKND